MANVGGDFRDLSRSVTDMLESLPAEAYVEACWVLCSEVERLVGERVPEAGRQLMRATLEELGEAVDADEPFAESPHAAELLAEWEELQDGRVENLVTGHVYFAFGDVAAMLAGRCEIGRAHSWLLNPVIDLLEEPRPSSGKGYERIDDVYDRENIRLSLYFTQILAMFSELESGDGPLNTTELKSLQARLFPIDVHRS